MNDRESLHRQRPHGMWDFFGEAEMQTPNFAATKYYVLLKQRVGEGSGEDNISGSGNESEVGPRRAQVSRASRFAYYRVFAKPP